jgi:hypothetical protein
MFESMVRFFHWILGTDPECFCDPIGPGGRE